MLVRNTEQLGAGLVMLGGQNSFGAGGWTNTELEKAMPVDFQIKNAKVGAGGGAGDDDARLGNGRGQPSGRRYRPGSHQGAGQPGLLRRHSLERHRPAGSGAAERHGHASATSSNAMLAALDRMTPGDMPDFDPAMQHGAAGLQERARRRRQAHDRHQRRRSLAAEPARRSMRS